MGGARHMCGLAHSPPSQSLALLMTRYLMSRVSCFTPWAGFGVPLMALASDTPCAGDLSVIALPEESGYVVSSERNRRY